MYMKTNPKLSNVVLIYINTTFKSTLRNSTKFELNKYNAFNRCLAVNADSSSALPDHGLFRFYLNMSRRIVIPIVIKKSANASERRSISSTNR